MKTFSVAYYTILRNIRDVKSQMNMLLLPIILILILGTALDGAFKVNSIKRPLVYYVNEDTGEASKAFDSFIKTEEISDIINVKSPESLEKAKTQIKNGDADGLIYIDSNYTKNISRENNAEIEVFTTDYSQIYSSIIKGIVSSFLSGANTIDSVRSSGKNVEGYKAYENIYEMPLSTQGKAPRAIDYYAVTMLIMIIMYGINYGTYADEEDKLNHTDIRIKTSNIKKMEYNIGKTIGNIATIFMQALIIIVFTKYVYKSNWNGSMITILYTCFILSVFAFGFGMLLNKFTKNFNQSGVITSTIVPIFTFIAGGYTPTVSQSSLISKIRFLSPNYLAQTAIFNNVYNGNSKTSYNSLIALTIISLTIFIILPYVDGRKNK